MRGNLFFYGRLFCLPFLSVLYFSCNKEKESNNFLSEKQEITSMYNDSIIISVNFKSQGIFGFNIKDKYHQYYSLEFKNNAHQDTTIIEKIPKYHKNQIINTSRFQFENGKPVFYENYFLVDSTKNKFSFDFSNNTIKLIDEESKIDVDSIHLIYNKIGLEIKNISKLDEKLRRKLHSELENLYLASLQKSNAVEKKIIETYYIYILQMIYPLDKKIDNFIENGELPIASNPFSSILFNYVNDRIDTFRFSELNSKKYS